MFIHRPLDSTLIEMHPDMTCWPVCVDEMMKRIDGFMQFLKQRNPQKINCKDTSVSSPLLSRGYFDECYNPLSNLSLQSSHK